LTDGPPPSSTSSTHSILLPEGANYPRRCVTMCTTLLEVFLSCGTQLPPLSSSKLDLIHGNA
jgi:hypothetical protein